MSQTPDQPGTPEAPRSEPIPSDSASPTQQWAASAPAKQSLWSEAVSSTGGKVALIVAGASLGLITLLGAGLLFGALAHHFGGDHPRAAWAGDSRQAPMPDRHSPGERAPRQVPPGQQRRGASDLPGLGLGLGGGTLHGEAVIPGDGSATQTVLFQRGQVTDLTTDKLTVKSTDGFSATYTIGADSRERLKNKVSTLSKGDGVSVVATKDGATTLRILKTGPNDETS